MHQAHPGHAGDGSLAAASDKAFIPLARTVLPPLSPFLLKYVAAKDVAKQKTRTPDSHGGFSPSSAEEKLAS